MRLLAAPALLYDWDAGWRSDDGSCGSRTQDAVQGASIERCSSRSASSAPPGSCCGGWSGRSAQWYRNVRAGHALEIAIARERFRPAYREVEPAEAVGVLAAYEERNRLIAPALRLVLSRLVGWRYDSTPAARQRLVSELPMIASRPAT